MRVRNVLTVNSYLDDGGYIRPSTSCIEFLILESDPTAPTEVRSVCNSWTSSWHHDLLTDFLCWLVRRQLLHCNLLYYIVSYTPAEYFSVKATDDHDYDSM